MATTVARLQAVLSADTRDFDKGMGKSEGKVKKFGRVAALGFGAVAGAGAILGVKTVKDLMRIEKITAQTNAVMESTGKVANVTTGQIVKHADALEKMSGVEAESVQEGQNMLLTFTKIRNEVGKGNKIFDQATEATLNMSVALGKDMQSSAIMVGKALNDPLKGLTALNKAGIQFTDTQKENIEHLIEGTKMYEALEKVTGARLVPSQVKLALEMQQAGKSVAEIGKAFDLTLTPAQNKAAAAMMKGGQVAEAQKIILAELETQFGGSAEAAGKTLGGQLEILKHRFGDVAEQVVSGLMPHLLRFTMWISGTAIPALTTMGNWLSRNRDTLKTVGIAVGVVTGLLLTYRLTTMAVTAATTAMSVATAVATTAKGLFTTSTVAATTAQTGLNTAMRLNPIGLVVTAIALLAAGVVVAYKKSETFRGIVDGLWSKLRGLGEWIREHWGTISSIIEKAPMVVAFKAMASSIDDVIGGVKWLIENLKRLPSIPGFGSGVSKADFPGGGDAHDPSYAGLNLMGASPVMAPFAAAAAGFGLRVTSGLRPGAITANGTPSDHGAGKALDVAGSASAMAGFFKALVGNRSVKQAFYDPLGSIFGGLWNSYREGGHSDHVHVATYDRGGILPPGLTLAYNGTGQNEYVGKGQPILVSLVLDTKEIARALFDPLKSENVRQGRLGRGLA